MFSTVEARWFFKGGIPGDIHIWFDQVNSSSVTQPVRTDYYLQQEEKTSLGIKLREGRIEIKQRVREFGQASFASNVVGIIEGWSKWSFLISSRQMGGLSLDVLGNSWLAVEKRRSLNSLQLVDKEIKWVQIPDFSIGGCNVVLTAIRVGNENWWSLGLESYGNGGANFDNLLFAAKHLFSGMFPQNLNTDHSFGYPQWLEQVKTC